MRTLNSNVERGSWG